MKKIILAIAAIAFLVGNSNAQDNNSAQGNGADSRDKLQLGLKAGVNYSNVYDAQGEEFNADSKFGFVAGGFLTVPIGKYLGIQPEILFSQKGFKATGRILGMDYTFTRTTNFIDIPVLIQLKPIATVTILVGPQFSYMIKQRDEFASALIETQFTNDNVQKNILCFIGGADINLDHFVLGARVGWDVTKNNGDGTSTNPRYKNVWYQATLGFKF